MRVDDMLVFLLKNLSVKLLKLYGSVARVWLSSRD